MRRKRDRRARTINDAPFAETDQTRRKMQAESLHKMNTIAVDAMHRKRPQHQAHLDRRGNVPGGRSAGGCTIRRPRIGLELGATAAGRPLESPELDISHERFCGRRWLHAIIAIQQIPQRLVDAQRARDVALFGVHSHQAAAGLLMGGIEIDDGGCNFVLALGVNMRRDQPRVEAAHQPVMDRLTFRKHPDPE